MPEFDEPVFRDLLFHQKRKHGKWREVEAPQLEGLVADTHAHLQLLADPVFLRALCVASNEKAVRVTAAAVRNQNYPLKNRLATFLLNTQHQGVYREPHAQAAAYLGVSYRHLLSVLAAFQREGLVEKTPEGYHLRDWAGLRALQIPDVLSP